GSAGVPPAGTRELIPRIPPVQKERGRTLLRPLMRTTSNPVSLLMRCRSFTPYFTHDHLHFCIAMTSLQYPNPCPLHVPSYGYTASMGVLQENASAQASIKSEIMKTPSVQ